MDLVRHLRPSAIPCVHVYQFTGLVYQFMVKSHVIGFIFLD